MDASKPPAAANREYPAAPRSDHVECFHGVTVADPYRWLEDLGTPQTQAWMDAQARFARAYLDALPEREPIAALLRETWNYERWAPPLRRGRRWTMQHNDGLQDQNVLLVCKHPDRAARVLLDPNALAADGSVALKGTDISRDGRLMVYGLSEAGSDWEVLRVRDIATASDLPDEIHWAKFTAPRWMADGSGFFYAGYRPPAAGEPLRAVNEFHTLYFHRLGTPQSEDEVVYVRNDAPDWFIDGRVTDDGHYLVLMASRGTEEKNTLLCRDLRRADAPVTMIVGEPRAHLDFVGNRGDVFYVRTDDGAPRYRIVAMTLRDPRPSRWRTVVPEAADAMAGATLVGGQLIVRYLEHARSRVRRFHPSGAELGEVPLPGIGTADGFQGGARDRTTYFRFDSYASPPAIYRLDLRSGGVRLWRRAQVRGFDPDEYETRQFFARSRDGTRVPVLVTARRDAPRDTPLPTILYGYGGFNIAMVPAFAPSYAAWLALGGVYAVANLRGGGEYGRDWHEAGTGTRKQNVFDDFIAAAETLQRHGTTDRRRLAILGGSNGGLLVAAVAQQRPDLFAAAVPVVGVLDMLRFREFTIGRAWESDFGSIDREEEFKALLAYSPYHNARAGVDYPAMMIVTADHDDRVYPAHSLKFGAAMQFANPRGRPILVRVARRAGHGLGTPISKHVDQFADILAFIAHQVGLAPDGAEQDRADAPGAAAVGR